MGLDPLQLRAVEATEGFVLVLGGPGTGKTQVLALRIAHLITEKRVDPGRFRGFIPPGKSLGDFDFDMAFESGLFIGGDPAYVSHRLLDLFRRSGGFGTLPQLQNEKILKFIRERSAQAKLTTSVCSGSARSSHR